MAQKKFEFQGLAGGGVAETLAAAFQEAAANLLDPNTSDKDKREVTLTFVLTPIPGRCGFTSEVKPKVKLAARIPLKTTFLVGQNLRTGEISIEEHFNQPLPLDTPLMDAMGGAGSGEPTGGNVTPMPTRAVQ